MDEEQHEKQRPEPYGYDKLSDAFDCMADALKEQGFDQLHTGTSPYELMQMIDKCPIVGDLQSSAVNGAAALAAAMMLGCMLAVVPLTTAHAALPGDTNRPGVRDLGPKPLEVPPIEDGSAEVPGPTPGGTVPQEPAGVETPEGAMAGTGGAAVPEGVGEPLPEAGSPEKKSQEPSPASSDPSGQ